MPRFDAQKIYSVENIMRKGEIACTSNSPFLTMFSTRCGNFFFFFFFFFFFHFKCTAKYRLRFLLIWTSLKFCRLVMSLAPFCKLVARAFFKGITAFGDIKLYLRSSLTLSQTTNFRLFRTESVCRRQF